MPQSCRQYFHALQGLTRVNFNWDAIDHDSVVLVQASEYSPDGNDLKHSPRFLGGAPITAENICPHGPPYYPNHGVTFHVNVNWGSPLNVVCDITVLDAKPVDTVWNKSALGFNMQQQQKSNWCWAANATSVALFYNAASGWTQCGLAGTVLNRTDCCNNPPAQGDPCNSGHNINEPLTTVGHFDHWDSGAAAFDSVVGWIDQGRPISVAIQWSGGGAHAPAIYGYDRDADHVYVDDSIYGKSDLTYDTFKSSYQGSGTWVETHYTKP